MSEVKCTMSFSQCPYKDITYLQGSPYMLCKVAIDVDGMYPLSEVNMSDMRSSAKAVGKIEVRFNIPFEVARRRCMQVIQNILVASNSTWYWKNTTWGQEIEPNLFSYLEKQR